MTWRRNDHRRREKTSTSLTQLSSWGSLAAAVGAPSVRQSEESSSMTIQLSEPMQNLLKSMGFGYAWDAFGVTGPLTHAARVRTCEALVKRGLLTISHGHYELTDTGQTISAGLNQQTA